MKAFLAENDPAAVLDNLSLRRARRPGRRRTCAGRCGNPGLQRHDGFEGDKSAEGKRTVNGWKNAGGEWTYTIREGFWPAAE